MPSSPRRGAAAPRGAWRSYDVFGDLEYIVVTFGYGEAEHAILVGIDMTTTRPAVIFLTVFIDLLGFGIIIPLLPYYAESFGASAFAVGMLGTSYSLMQFLFAPVWGRWSDRIGRRPIILIGLLGAGAAMEFANLYVRDLK